MNEQIVNMPLLVGDTVVGVVTGFDGVTYQCKLWGRAVGRETSVNSKEVIAYYVRGSTREEDSI